MLYEVITVPQIAEPPADREGAASVEASGPAGEEDNLQSDTPPAPA